MLVAAWATSRTILVDGDAPDRGYARLAYGDLNEAGVMLLAALVTLTPGTSTIDIDAEQYELLLHMLDTRDIDTVLEELRRDFLLPIRSLFGARS
jgi:multisubunit Na+/H+ antiporter MnhE subunit